MTVTISLKYFMFTDKLTIIRGNNVGQSSGARWMISVTRSDGFPTIPPPEFYWIDAATAEILLTGIRLLITFRSSA